MLCFCRYFLPVNSGAEVSDFLQSLFLNIKLKAEGIRFLEIGCVTYVRTQSNVQISSLMLEGITITGKNKSALRGLPAVFFSNYIFEDGRLFGDNSKVIEGVSGKILNDNELLLKQGDKEIIFKLEKDMTGYNILPEE